MPPRCARRLGCEGIRLHAALLWNWNFKIVCSRTPTGRVSIRVVTSGLTRRGDSTHQQSNGNRATRERGTPGLAKIKTTVQIPNPSTCKEVVPALRRRDSAAQRTRRYRPAVGVTSVFPIQDFAVVATGSWTTRLATGSASAGHLRGLDHLRATCRNCGASVVTNPYKTGDVLCTKCGNFNKNTPTFWNKSEIRSLATEV